MGILKTLSRVLNGAAIADFVTSDRVTTVDDDIKNGEYGKAAVTGLEALLTAGAIGSGISGGLGATGTYIYLRNEKGSR